MLHALFFWPLFFWSPFHGLGGLIVAVIVLALIFGPRRYYYWRHPYYDRPWNWPAGGGTGSRAEGFQGGETDAISNLRKSRQEIILVRTQRRIRRCSRCYHSSHFAAHQLLGELCIFHLLTDCDFESLADELANVS